MTKLRDLMRDDYQNAHHAFFPGRSAAEVQQEWAMFTEAVVQPTINMILAYHDTMVIPERGTVGVLDPLPAGFYTYLVDVIDDNLPHWGLVQRTLMYSRLVDTFYDGSITMWNDRVAMRDRKDNGFVDDIIRQATADN